MLLLMQNLLGVSVLALGILSAGATLSSCGDSGGPGGKKAVQARPFEGPSRSKRGEAEGRAIDPATTGTIRGVVRFEGIPPKRKALALSSAQGCEHHGPGEALTESVVVKDGFLQNVFVTVESGLEGWELPPLSSEPEVLDQRGCVYRPHVLAVRTGRKILVRNSDAATHNVNAGPRRGERINKTQPPGSAPLELQFDRYELGIPIGCDIHPWMKAWVCVEEHPFFDVTGSDGSFEISGLPPGEYRIVARHESYGAVEETVALAAGGSAEVALVVSADGGIPGHGTAR